MSSPPPPLPSPRPTPSHFHRSSLVTPIAVSAVAAFSCLLLLLLFLFTRFSRRRNATTADSKPPHRYPYSLLRRATDSFSASRRLGQGGFGSVFSGSLPNSDKPVAIKLMDSGSLQGEREFQNELFFAGILNSPLTVPALGFSFNKNRRRMLIVYELMPNGNLQDALLHRKCTELMEWENRFTVAVDIARGIEYLHSLDPPVIHGDIKPSNILLDQYFSAKIGDFGLARVKSENQREITVFESELSKPEVSGLEAVRKPPLPAPASESEIATADDNGSVLETESVATTAFEEFNVNGVDQSPENHVKIMISDTLQEMASASPRNVPAAATSPEMSFDKSSLDSGKRSYNKGMIKTLSGKDWWWKQENSASESGRVKDYVMEWIGSEINKERPKSDWLGAGSSSCETSKKPEKKNKNSRKRLDWWVSMDEEKNSKKTKKEKRRPAREWWKEEYCDELARKKKKKKQHVGNDASNDNYNAAEDWWSRDEELYSERKKKSRSRSRSRRSSKSSVDWWLDGISGDLWRVRRNSCDSVEVPRSGGISSTPSMRGTVCYIAPEYGGGGDLSEKCDVYSFGVLLLVVVAGRRPLQVTGSPMSEFQRANLISWAKHLARAGKLLDLVDQSIKSLDKEQALLCITVALLCLQKSPICRPSMKEVVAMLTGASDPPQLPFEFSPSPPSHFPFKSQRKAR